MKSPQDGHLNAAMRMTGAVKISFGIRHDEDRSGDSGGENFLKMGTTIGVPARIFTPENWVRNGCSDRLVGVGSANLAVKIIP